MSRHWNELTVSEESRKVVASMVERVNEESFLGCIAFDTVDAGVNFNLVVYYT